MSRVHLEKMSSWCNGGAVYFRGTDTYVGLVEGEGGGPQWNANLVVLNLNGGKADGCLTAAWKPSV